MKKLYRVVRRHDGDKPYQVGDVREGYEHELRHLIPSCLQEIKAEAEKAAPAHANKQAPAVKNKAARAND